MHPLSTTYGVDPTQSTSAISAHISTANTRLNGIACWPWWAWWAWWAWTLDANSIAAHRPAFHDRYGYIEASGVKLASASVSVWYTPLDQRVDVDVEVTFPLTQAIAGSVRVKVRTPPGDYVASWLPMGDFRQFSQASVVITQWMEASGDAQSGPLREVCHMFDRKHPDDVAVEAQFLVHMR